MWVGGAGGGVKLWCHCLWQVTGHGVEVTARREGRDARDAGSGEVRVGRGRENNAPERRDKHTRVQTQIHGDMGRERGRKRERKRNGLTDSQPHQAGRQPGHRPHQEPPSTPAFPYLCHLQQKGIHNIACRA